MLPPYYNKTYSSYYRKFKQKMAVIFIWLDSKSKGEEIMQKAIDKNKVLTKEEIIKDFLDGDKKRFDDFFKQEGFKEILELGDD